MDLMRYLFAALIAAFIMTVDLSLDDFGRLLWTNSLGAIADAQANSLSRPPERVTDHTATVPSGQSTELALEESPSSEDNQATAAALGNGTAVPIALDRVCEAIRDAAIESGIPVGFFARLLWQESNFRSEEISSAGARGIAQFMPQTAAEVGLVDPFDPLEAIPASAKFLRKLHDQFGNLGLAAAAYNAGGGRIAKWLSRRLPLPQETRAYVKIITGNKAEDWATESKIVSLPTDLPRGAPCDGIEGLSKSKHNQVAEIPVRLTSSVSEILRKAEDDDVKVRRRAIRIILKATSVARARMPSMAGGKSTSIRSALQARTHGSARATRKTTIRLASASVISQSAAVSRNGLLP